MSKITILSKPEEKVSSKGTKYWKAKVADENGEEKYGSIFSDTEPQIDESLEVEEKYNDQYKSFSWFTKKDNQKKGGFPSRPSLSVDQQIRIVALQEAVKTSGNTPTKSGDIVTVAKFYENYIREGK
ncbi:MAG: hypothetical protein WC238_04535 [Parcubacteria group bacterium]|jgi:hypothetical protein